MFVKVGQRYGMLTVIALGNRVGNKRYVTCRCDCGTVKSIRADSLFSSTGRPVTVSCGCYVRNRKGTAYIDDRSKTKLYHVWYGILERCNNPNSTPYKYYGGRGIKCDFNSWEEFRDWSHANGYAEGLSIDRIDPNGNYSKDNCRWVTSDVQQANRRKSTQYYRIDVDGVEYTVASLAKKLGINYWTLYYRFTHDREKFIQSVTTMAKASTVTILARYQEAGGPQVRTEVKI